MNHFDALFKGEQKKWWILPIVLLLLLCIIGQVHGSYNITFNPNTASVQYFNSSQNVPAGNLLEIIIICIVLAIFFFGWRK